MSGPDPGRAELDRLYDLRARHPDHPATFARWRQLSAGARARLRCRLDLAYGPGPAERLDLFPAAPGAPILTFVHGGYWQSMDKADSSFLAPPFVAAGIAVAVIGYALAPAAPIARMVEQVRRAHAWLAAAAGVPVVASGHSAGGHLVAMLRTAPAAPVAGVLSIAGVYDLEPIRRSFLNAALGLDAAAARRLSPLGLPPVPGVPVRAVVGADESEALVAQQAAFAAAWTAAGAPVDARVLPGLHHFTIVDALADPAHPLHRETVAFVRACAGGG